MFDLGYQPRHETDYHASTLYGISKSRGEDIVRSATDLGGWTIVRPTGIWGPWFGEPYRRFFELIRRGSYVHPSARPILKSFGYVENLVHQLHRLAQAPPARVHGRTFWLADYQPVVVSEWASDIAAKSGARSIPTVPVSFLRVAAVVGDLAAKVGVGFPMTSFRLDNLTTDMVFDLSATEEVVGSLPFSAEQGTSRTIEWLRQRGVGSL